MRIRLDRLDELGGQGVKGVVLGFLRLIVLRMLSVFASVYGAVVCLCLELRKDIT